MATGLTVQDWYQEIIPDPNEDDNDDELYHLDQDDNLDDNDDVDDGSDEDNDDDPNNGRGMPANDPMIPVDVLTPEEPAPPPNVENEFLLPLLNDIEVEHIEPEGVPIDDNAQFMWNHRWLLICPWIHIPSKPPADPTINPQLTHELHQIEIDGHAPPVLQAHTHSGQVFNILDQEISNEFECLDEIC